MLDANGISQNLDAHLPPPLESPPPEVYNEIGWRTAVGLWLPGTTHMSVEPQLRRQAGRQPEARHGRVPVLFVWATSPYTQ